MKTWISSSILGLCLSVLSLSGHSQSTAMDFHRMDCNGNMQHLFADLDAGNAVILEFFMQNCSPCITAGNKLEAMKADLLAEFPGKIKGYSIGFNNSYSCASNLAWVNNNGFSTIAMDSGAAQVAYYGGMGMPTIVILGGGTSHSVLGSPYVGFSTSDTTQMAADIRGFLNTATGITDNTSFEQGITVYPNPSKDLINFSCFVTEVGNLAVEVVDLTGRRVMVLMNEVVAPGKVERTFSTAGIAAGAYIVKARVNRTESSHRLTVVQ